MFNTTIIRYDPSHVSVSEQRAPTDDSVRLLREMEEAALQSVLKTMEVKNNLFEGKVIFMRHTPLAEVKLIALFKLNGQLLTARSTMDEAEYFMHGEARASELIVESVATAIMGELSKNLVFSP